MVWSIAVANILGSGLCFLLSGQFAKLATLRYTLIIPVVLSLIYIGAFEGTRQWGDLISLMFFGLLGWCMKHAKWPRPPLILGFILGGILERYFFISTVRYGWTGWLSRPVVIIVLCLAVLGLSRSFIEDVRGHGGLMGMVRGFDRRPCFALGSFFPAFMLLIMGAMVVSATEWNFSAKIGPLVVGIAGLVFCLVSLLNEVFRARREELARLSQTTEPAQTETEGLGRPGKIHMDIPSMLADLPRQTIFLRGAAFFGWMFGFMASMAIIGLIPTVPIFITAYMRVERKEHWLLVAGYAVFMTLFIYGLFDQLLAVPWPQTVLGNWFPELKEIIPSM
jgi:hypothetical protein